MVKGNVIASTVRPGWKSSQADRPGSELETIPEEDNNMMIEDDPEIDADVEYEMDDNDTIITNKDNSFEEWVVKELSLFPVGAITNRKFGLVDTDNFEVGTWYLNRWLANKNNNNARNSLLSSHMIICDCISNNINI